MRIVESFESWAVDADVNESIQAAKAFMQNRYAKRKRKELAALTPEERAEALADPVYLEILDMVKGSPNYAGAFVKFHFEHGAPMNRLKELFTTLQTKKHLISQLSKQIDQYAAQEPENGIQGFERLEDELRTIERNKEAKWIVDRLPRAPREQFRQLDPSEQQVFYNAAHQLKELGETIVTRLMIKIKAMETWPIKDIIHYTLNYIKGYSNAQMKKKVDELLALEPEAGMLYLDDRYLAMSVRTEASQKALCAVANWCINRGSFSNYANDAVQINIFDFGTTPDDPMFLIGTTIYYTGKTRTTHDINDKYIQKSADPRQNLIQLGYPTAMVDNLLSTLPTEMLIKKVVYELKLDKLKPIDVLKQIITQSYTVDPSTNQETLEIVLDIIRTRLKDNLTTEEIVKLYTDYGVMTKFSAIVMLDLLGQASPADLEKIKQATVSIFAEVNAIAQSDPSLVFDQVKNVLAQEKDVMQILGISRADLDQAINEALNEYTMTEPAREPAEKETITKPAPAVRPRPTPRPGPIPTKKPAAKPEPSAEAEDVIDRLMKELKLAGTNVKQFLEQ